MHFWYFVFIWKIMWPFNWTNLKSHHLFKYQLCNFFIKNIQLLWIAKYAEIMKTIIHAVRPIFTWDLLCLARLVVIAWPTLSKKEATPRRTKGMRSQCWIQFNVSLMISSSVYIQNISLLGNKVSRRVFSVFLCFDTCECVNNTVCKNLWLAR